MKQNPLTNGLPPVHPGTILREQTFPNLVDPETGEKPTLIRLASYLGMTRQGLGLILDGDRPVTVKTAVRLAKILGSSAEIWINMQAAYDLKLAEAKIDVSALPVFARAE
tara:strand:- start:1147 stop:1476 length:330 start_codon:yes stop_codon:yes gene_type:complete